MAVITACFFVCAINFEICVFVMIKQPILPGIWIMAGLAVGTESSLVNIVGRVAGVAFILGRAVNRAQMAFLTLNGGMHADQREVAKVMVEEDFIAPAGCVVTVNALLALLALVNVVFLVASDTVGFHLIFFNFALMAIGACQLFVFST